MKIQNRRKRTQGQKIQAFEKRCRIRRKYYNDATSLSMASLRARASASFFNRNRKVKLLPSSCPMKLTDCFKREQLRPLYSLKF